MLLTDVFDKFSQFTGNATHCHIYSLFSLIPELNQTFEPYFIDLISTVPFGLKSVPNDPNRQLTCFIDPDLGLDRAIHTLGLDFEVKSWPIGFSCESEALEILKNWLCSTPVLVGPVNMAQLSYLFHPELLLNCDHYLVVTEFKDGKVHVIDSEGFINANLTEEIFLNCWRGDAIPEGRGSCVIRRIVGQQFISNQEELIKKTLPIAISNLSNAIDQPYCGPSAYSALANEASLIMSNPSMLRGLMFTIPTRIQRLAAIYTFFKAASKLLYLDIHSLKIDQIILCQIEILGDILLKIRERYNPDLQRFEKLAELEFHLAQLCKQYFSHTIFQDLRDL